jgi:hypothetical protein
MAEITMSQQRFVATMQCRTAIFSDAQFDEAKRGLVFLQR